MASYFGTHNHPMVILLCWKSVLGILLQVQCRSVEVLSSQGSQFVESLHWWFVEPLTRFWAPFAWNFELEGNSMHHEWKYIYFTKLVVGNLVLGMQIYMYLKCHWLDQLLKIRSKERERILCRILTNPKRKGYRFLTAIGEDPSRRKWREESKFT